ncbi:hypothetical protein BJ970_007239 [Saccharopolyspora phatthalungensis]|uniref:Uncharacterized protein n=1 Tax=Saccharopolyspora phatthalungensis TaxID=664693 RepID=A0A840QHW9_9PSEU|nr:hypothetical protein [Saccharopolyspora phatthalungensis]
MNATEADRAVKLAALMTRAAAALNSLATSVLIGRAIDDDLLDTERLRKPAVAGSANALSRTATVIKAPPRGARLGSTR